MPKEPDITINGRKLTTGQAMTVRVAIETFAMAITDDIAKGDMQGDDSVLEHAYLARIREIRAFYVAA